MILTKHTETRFQQRCIPKLVLDLLLDHGVIEHQHGSTELVYFKTNNLTNARKHLENMLKEFDKMKVTYLSGVSKLRTLSLLHQAIYRAVQEQKPSKC